MSTIWYEILFSTLQLLGSFSGFTDETPRDYQCNLGPDGRRRDADERPELCRGTVEFIASKDYMVSYLMFRKIISTNLISDVASMWFLCYEFV